MTRRGKAKKNFFFLHIFPLAYISLCAWPSNWLSSVYYSVKFEATRTKRSVDHTISFIDVTFLSGTHKRVWARNKYGRPNYSSPTSLQAWCTRGSNKSSMPLNEKGKSTPPADNCANTVWNKGNNNNKNSNIFKIVVLKFRLSCN